MKSKKVLSTIIFLLGVVFVFFVVALPFKWAALAFLLFLIIGANKQSRQEKTDKFLIGNPKFWKWVTLFLVLMIAVLLIMMYKGTVPDFLENDLSDLGLDVSLSNKTQDVNITSTGPNIDLYGDLGPQLTPAPSFQTESVGFVDWDHLEKIEVPNELVTMGLSGCPVTYLQSGTPNTLVLNPETMSSEQEALDFIYMSEGLTLIFGGLEADLDTLGEDYSFSNGVLAVLGSGFTFKELSITNGFALIIENSCAREEFCLRIAQAVEEDWAMENVHYGKGWESCGGANSVPLDSDR